MVIKRKKAAVVEQINLLISFLLELVLLYLVGYSGFHLAADPVSKYVLAIVLPSIVMVLWGIFAAPKSRHRLKNPIRVIFKLALFFLGALLAYFAGNRTWAVAFAVIVVLNAGLAFLLGQDY